VAVDIRLSAAETISVESIPLGGAVVAAIAGMAWQRAAGQN